MKFIEYPSIKHFSEAKSASAKAVKSIGQSNPIGFVGSVKLHGSNFSFVFDMESDRKRDPKHFFQSRNRIIGEDEDFLGHKDLMNNAVKEVLIDSIDEFRFTKYIHKRCSEERFIVFGELVGGKIQKDVALAQLPVQFVVFDIAITGNGTTRFFSWSDLQLFNAELKKLASCFGVSDRISCVCDFPTWTTSINVSSQADMFATQDYISNITKQVEAVCPFAAQKGVTGIGEGVVWRSTNTPDTLNEGFGIRFKVKGEEHSNSKVRTLDGVEAAKIEALRSIEEVCEAVCTEARFKQGMHYLVENSIEEKQKKSTFMRWVVEDAIKEKSDFIIAKGITIEKAKAQLFKNALMYWQTVGVRN